MSRYVQILTAAVVVGLVVAAAYYADSVSADVASVADFTRDPTDVAGVPWWAGAVSRITVMGWVVAAVAALLAGRHAEPRQRPRLLLFGVLCGVSALDDTLLLHEEVMPSLGLPEDPFLVLYAIAGLALAVLWVRSGERTLVELAFFGGAFMLATSILVDAFLQRVVVEDVAKLIGVVAWALCGVWAHGDLSRRPPARSSRMTLPAEGHR